MDGGAVTALVFDAAPAQQGAAQFEAAGQKIITTNQGVVTATTRTIDAQAQAERAYAKLVRTLDPLAAAQSVLERGQRQVENAFQRGRISADEYSKRLEQLDARYARVAASADRATASQNSLTVAARDAAQAQAAYAQSFAELGAEMDRVRAKYVPLAAAQQSFRAQMTDIAEAERLGILRTSEAAAARDKAKDGFRDQIRVINGYGAAHTDASKAVGLTRRELQQLSPQIADVGVSLAGGISPLLVLIQQGPQIADAVGGVGRSLTLLRAAAVAAAPYLAIVLGVGAPLLALNAVEGRLSDLRGMLRGVTEDYRATAVEVEAASRRIAAAGIGVSYDDATKVQGILRRAAPEGSSFDFEALTRQAADFAKVLGVDVPQAAEQMAQGLRDPAGLVKQLADRNLPGMTEALRLTAERLVQAGERGDAAALVLGRINEAVRGQAADVPPLTAAWRQLSGAMGSLWDDITKGLAGPGATLLTWMADVVSAVRRVRDTSAAGVNQGLVPQYDAAGNPTGQYVTDPSVAGRMDETMRTYVRRVAELEAGNRPGAINSLGYAGLYQFGAAAAQSAGVYTPAAGENLRANGWQGTFNIPGYENIRTLRDFLGSPDAQTAVMQLHTATIDRAIAALGPLAQGLDRNGLRYVAHAGGPAGMTRWVQSRGGYDPSDAFGTSLGAAYQRMTGQAAFAGAAGAAVPVTVVGATPSASSVDAVTELLNRATRIARGEEGRPSPLQSVDTQRGVIAANMATLQRAAASGQATPEQMEAITRGLEAQRAAYEGTLTAAERMVRTEQERTQVLTNLDPVQRELAQAVQQYRDAQRAAGRDADPAEEARIQTAVLGRLRAEYGDVTDAARRQADASQRVAQAYGQSAAAGRQQEAQEKAVDAVRRSGIQGAAARALAEQDLTKEIERGARADAERALNQRNNQTRDELAYLEREAQLVGANADARERELAALRARQQAGAAGGTGAAQEAERLAVRMVEVRQNTTWLQNSWGELATLGENTFSKIGDSISDGFAKGQISAIRFGDIAKAALAQAALKLAIVNPALNAVFGGNRGTLGGITQIAGLGNLSLGGSQIVADPNTGSLSLAMNQASQTSTLMAAGRYGNLGTAFSNQGVANTGWAFADGVLNTPLIGQGGLLASTATAANGLPIVGLGTGADGVLTAAPMVSGTTYNGLSVAGGLGAAAGIGLGGLAIYQGIQKGGIGGGVGVAGGVAGIAGGAATLAGAYGASLAAAGSTGLLASSAGALSAFGPIGMVAAAVLAIVSALLPGQKPSGRGQETAIDLASGASAYRGLGGDRYSQGNRDQSEAAVQQIATLATQLGDALGGVRLQTSAAVGVTQKQLYLRVGEQRDQFGNNEDGAKALADKAGEFLLNEFRKVVTQGDFAGILNASPTVDALKENLTWYNDTYEAFGESAKAANAYQQALDQVTASFQVNIDKAQELSLATDVVTAARDKELAKVTAQRDLQFSSFDEGLTIRALQANGGDTGPMMLDIALRQFDLAAKQQLESSRTTLESLGVTSDDVTQRLAWNEEVLASERLKIQRDYAAHSTAITTQQMQQAANSATSLITSLAEYARALAFSDKSALSAQDQYDLALRQFNAVSGAALAGDATSLSKLQSYSDTLLGASRAMFGSGASFAGDFGRVADVLARVGDLSADTLTASYFAQITMQANQDNATQVVTALQVLQARVEELTSIVSQQGLAPARAA